MGLDRFLRGLQELSRVFFSKDGLSLADVLAKTLVHCLNLAAGG